MKDKKKIIKRILVSLLIIGIVFLSGYIATQLVLGSLLTEDEKVEGWKNSELVDEFGNTINLEEQNAKKKPGAYNILVGATDKGGSRTDSIMLVHYDTVEDKIACMSIPRDTYIATSRGSKKINAAYAYGRSEEFVAKTEETFGIDVDYYVILDVNTFRNVVDAMGGVEVDVQFDMNYDDPAQNLSIHIKKGKQTLMGKEAEGFVRYRKGYAAADIARIDAQQIFIASAINKIKDNPTLIPKVITTAFEGIKTNIKQDNALEIATSAIGMDFSEIKMFKLPGRSASRNGVSYYSLYKDETLRIINEYFNTYNKDIKPSQCAMIELIAPPDGYVYEDERSLSETAEATPPQKSYFSSSVEEEPEEIEEIIEPDVVEKEAAENAEDTPEIIEGEENVSPDVIEDVESDENLEGNTEDELLDDDEESLDLIEGTDDNDAEDMKEETNKDASTDEFEDNIQQDGKIEDEGILDETRMDMIE